MKSVRKIESPGHPIECFCGQGGVFQSDMRQPGKGAQRRSDLSRGIAIGAAQDPFRLQENGRADEDVLPIDQAARFRRLLKVIARQIANDQIGINREHDAA